MNHLPATGDPGLPVPEPSGVPADPEASQSKEWWDDPSLPWRRKPTRADIACMSWMGGVAVYALVMLPLRPAILALSPVVVGALGYRTGLVMTGALASVGNPWWPLVLVLGTIGSIKFDWVYWWAGKLWGRTLIESWSGRSERARRRNERAERFAKKYETLAIIATFLPIPLPAGVIYAVLGEAGTSLKKFLTVGSLSGLVTTGLYMALGFWIGEPAVAVMDAYGQYLWYLSLGILAVMLIGWWWKQRKAGATES